MEARLFTITDAVKDRTDGRARWVVTATFVTTDSAEPRCIDYRVRVVQRAASELGDPLQIRQTTDAMRRAAMTVDEAYELGEFPSSGIPGYVFEVASQASLLRRMRDWVEEQPQRFEMATQDFVKRVPVDRAGKVRRGRPPARSFQEKLRILAAVEAAYASGQSRASVASAHFMSESALRNLLTWARKSADPQLFTGDGRPGVKAGRLTPAARQMLKDGENG